MKLISQTCYWQSDQNMRFNIVRDHGNFGLIRIINIRDIKDKVTVSDFQSALKRNYTPKNLINKNIKAFNYIYNILYTIYIAYVFNLGVRLRWLHII